MAAAEVGPLVVAGVLSVMLYPIAASWLLGQQLRPRQTTYSDHDGL
jgi:hypothetical protein